MTEDEKDAELVAWMKDRYDLEKILAMAESSESMDAIILAGEIRQLRGAVKAAKALHVATMENGEPVGCYTCDWDIDPNWPCKTLRALGGK